MLKKILAGAAIAVTAALLAPTAASANAYREITLNPGERHCERDYPAYVEARGRGTVLSGHNVRFTFGTFAPVQQRLADSVSPVPSFFAQASRYTHPFSFPGYFQLCAINQSLKASTVSLELFSY